MPKRREHTISSAQASSRADPAVAPRIEAKSTVANYVVPRLTAVVEATDKAGVTGLTGWVGGGGFRVVDVHPSMFERVDGRVVVAPWATNGKLAQAVAAQAAFAYDPGSAPFCGAKGKTKLAVVDGLLSPEVVSFLVAWLADDELLSVYGTAVDPDCRSALAEMRRGSDVKKIPQSILDDYRRSRRTRLGVIDWPVVIRDDQPNDDDAEVAGDD